MDTLYGLDAFTPSQIAARVSELGVAKTRPPFPTLFMPACSRGPSSGWARSST